MINVAVIILNWNKPALSLKAAKSIIWQNDIDAKVIIADNGSTDSSVEIFLRESVFDVLKLDKNYGYAQGYNKAVQYAIDRYNPEYLFLLNNDATVFPNTLNELYANRGTADIISPEIYYPNGKTLWACGGNVNAWRALAKNRGQGEIDAGQYKNISNVDFASGCALWIKIAVVEKIGLFNPEYQFYYEDVDFCFRARKTGFIIKYLPTAKLLHWTSQTCGDEYGPFQSRYRWRNRFIFAKNNINKIQFLFFVLIALPLIIIRDSFRYINKGKVKELGNAYSGLLMQIMTEKSIV